MPTKPKAKIRMSTKLNLTRRFIGVASFTVFQISLRNSPAHISRGEGSDPTPDIERDALRSGRESWHRPDVAPSVRRNSFANPLKVRTTAEDPQKSQDGLISAPVVSCPQSERSGVGGYPGRAQAWYRR